jgi:hypothetical protein
MPNGKLGRIYTVFVNHGRSSRVFHGLPHLSAHIHGKPHKSISKIVRMVSTASAEQQWTASRVRDTFLGYFEDNGHTFGMLADFLASSDL